MPTTPVSTEEMMALEGTYAKAPPGELGYAVDGRDLELQADGSAAARFTVTPK